MIKDVELVSSASKILLINKYESVNVSENTAIWNLQTMNVVWIINGLSSARVSEWASEWVCCVCMCAEPRSTQDKKIGNYARISVTHRNGLFNN